MKRLLFFCLFFLFFPAFSLAQHPRMAMDSSPSFENPIIITNPETSRAFYGSLDGIPEFYKISSEEPFTLYVGIRLPDIPDFREKRFSVEIKDEYNETLFLIDERMGQWVPFLDEFGGDRYVVGPEIKKYVPEGNYTIEVSSAENTGRYSLVVGDVDVFSVTEIIKSLAIMPEIKQRFFGMDAIDSYINASGVAALILAILLAFFLAFSLRHLRNNLVK